MRSSNAGRPSRSSQSHPDTSFERYEDADDADDAQDAQANQAVPLDATLSQYLIRRYKMNTTTDTEDEFLDFSEATREAQGACVPTSRRSYRGSVYSLRLEWRVEYCGNQRRSQEYRHAHRIFSLPKATAVTKPTEIDTLEKLGDAAVKTLPSEKHQYLTYSIGLRSPR